MSPDFFDFIYERQVQGVAIGKPVGSLGGVKLPDAGRTLGTRVVGEAGSGKSVLLGAIAFGDFIRGIPVVLWDHNGGMIDAFFAQVLGHADCDALLDRVRYVEFGNSQFAYGLPFYFDAGGDDGFTMSQRLVDILLKLDPELSSAPVLGESSVVQLGTMVGTILSSVLDADGNRFQITEAPDLLANYNSPFWLKVRSDLGERIGPAEKFLTGNYSKSTPSERRLRSWSFESRIWSYLNSPALKATVGQGRPTILWEDVFDRQLAVIFDFRHLGSEKPLEHLSLLTFEYFLTFLKRRGIAARAPISLLIDELPTLIEYQSLEPDVRALATRFRAYKLWPTIGHQAIYQLSPKLKDAAWSFRNQIVGQQANISDAQDVVENLLETDDTVKRRTLAQLVQRLPARRFLFRRSLNESQTDRQTYWIRTQDVPELAKVSPQEIAEAKYQNQERFAPRVDEVLTKINDRIGQADAFVQPRPKV